jgi:hypothetical protein
MLETLDIICAGYHENCSEQPSKIIKPNHRSLLVFQYLPSYYSQPLIESALAIRDKIETAGVYLLLLPHVNLSNLRLTASRPTTLNYPKCRLSLRFG